MVAALHSLPLSPVHLSIDSDQEVATAVLQEIAMVCRVHGAEWHPQLTAEVSGGAMRLLAPPGTGAPGEPSWPRPPDAREQSFKR